MSASLEKIVTDLARRARAASLALATAPTAAKNAALARLAELLPAGTDTLLAANAKDVAAARASKLTTDQVDRLTLNPQRIAQMVEGVKQVAALPDPVGEELERTIPPNGLEIRKVRVPIGVIGIIYEARPNVTIDCAVLCLKSGNAAILRGGKESFHTNTALVAVIHQAIAESELGRWQPALGSTAVQLIPTTDRAALTALLRLDSLVHCIIPRGGESLIRFVAEHSTIPVIKHFKGVCFVYVDREADPAMAEHIVVNAKAQRPAVCNAAEQLLVHAGVAERLLPRLARALLARKVELRCDAASAAILRQHQLAHRPARAADFRTEFLDLIMAVRVAPSLDEAIATINRDSSAHTDAIVTRDADAARRFLAGVDSAVVLWNASTRFNDGFEFGLGAEIGISTDRLHARGPMGLRELCSYKYLVTGSGQVRG
jgi:glutamate-5-semialdehyde dehydrogenase